MWRQIFSNNQFAEMGGSQQGLNVRTHRYPLYAQENQVTWMVENDGSRTHQTGCGVNCGLAAGQLSGMNKGI